MSHRGKGKCRLSCLAFFMDSTRVWNRFLNAKQCRELVRVMHEGVFLNKKINLTFIFSLIQYSTVNPVLPLVHRWAPIHVSV